VYNNNNFTFRTCFVKNYFILCLIKIQVSKNSVCAQYGFEMNLFQYF